MAATALEGRTMKIDIHTHTRKCKSGDAPTRHISAKDFCEKVMSTAVGIIAITNHNVFDLEQYQEISNRLDGQQAQVWPGVELDILESGSRGHLIVIVSPAAAKHFLAAVDGLTKGFTPDSFTTTIAKVLEIFEPLGPLYIAHYKQKKPAISDSVLDVLVAGTKCPERVIKEVTNSISAGIYISHGHASIYGSDIHDWAMYEEKSRDLPDLRLQVDSFEHFCLLLKKDATAINSVLDKKTAEELELRPFGDDTLLKIKAFNDINVIFGPKGTGKTCILDAIAAHYSAAGLETKRYESKTDRLDEIFDIKGKNLTINLNAHGIKSYCTDEIAALRGVTEVAVTSLERYVNYFRVTSKNVIAKKILLKDIDPEEEIGAGRDFQEGRSATAKTNEFLEFASNDQSIQRALTEEEFAQLQKLLSALLSRLRDSSWRTFSKWKEIVLLNSAIKKVRSEVERKTGNPAKPATTGFREYAINRMKVEASAMRIVGGLESVIPIQTEVVGSLGENKGHLEFVTEFRFQTGGLTDVAFAPVAHGVKKIAQKKFVNSVRKIMASAYADDLFKHIADLNQIEDSENIKTIHELLLFSRNFALGGQRYSPSSGEASMVMLQKELETDKDVYILDEPERSLGNEYISDVIVPLIKERARAGKKVFISTHDANIAVRTLPYSSIYRCHERLGYRTYVGNPFSNHLVDLNDSASRLDWKKISMKTLEGGEQAFGERGKIYGNG